jgi:hypothetical protein
MFAKLKGLFRSKTGVLGTATAGGALIIRFLDWLGRVDTARGLVGRWSGVLPTITAFLLSTPGQWFIFLFGVGLILWALRSRSKASPDVNQLAYRTVGVTVILVDFAMKTWADYVVAGNATPAQETRVRNAYEKYQAVAKRARIALTTTSDSPTPPALVSAAAEIVAFVATATGVVVSMFRPSSDARPRLVDDDDGKTYFFAAPLIGDDENAVLQSRLSEVTGSVGLSAAQNDLGSMALMKDLANVFRKAGWTVISEEPVWFRGLEEIYIEAHSQDSALARFVQTVLKSIDVETKCMAAPTLPHDQIQIKIGKTKW